MRKVVGFKVTFEKELVDEIVRREAGNEFQLYRADNMKAREQVEWVLFRWWCRGGTCLMILLLSY